MTYRRSAAPTARSTKARRPPTAGGAGPSYAKLSTKVGRGLELSIDWATEVLENDKSEKWEKAQAMTFFAKLQHLIIPAEGEKTDSPMDKFLGQMAKIRDVPLPAPIVADVDEDEGNAVFEAPAV